MVMHAWSEHVVHVRLVSDDGEIAAAAARFLQLRFSVEDVEVGVEPGRLRVHSEPGRRVTGAVVAQALVEAGVRAHALYEREEWSVADV